MPLYEYRCHSCGEVFEVRQNFSDEPLAKHEKCGGEVERLISAPALQFKGSGWYITDYARGNGKSARSSDSGDGAKSDGAKSEAAKKETKSSSDSGSASSSSTPEKK